MTQIACSDHNRRQPDREPQDKLVQAFDMGPGGQSASEQCTHAAQRLSALGEMTGGIVHDLRNILMIIESGLRLAEKVSGQPDKVRGYIAGARVGIERGTKLTSQILAFAQQREVEAQARDVSELLRNLEQFLRYGAGPGINVVLKLASDIPKCLIDPSQFSAALLNLVVNARDAMPNGGEIQICTERCTVEAARLDSPLPHTYARVRVKDAGLGMSEEVIRKIFDPFFTTKGENGTGLGLPQVRAFMRLAGGHMNVISEREIGTTVDLLFPSVEPDAIVAPLAKVGFEREFVCRRPLRRISTNEATT